VVTLHGSGGCAEKVFHWWTTLSAQRQYAIAALQCAEEDPATGEVRLDSGFQVYDNLRAMLTQLQAHCPLDDVPVVLHGFSWGSARTLEVALLDRGDEGMHAFSSFICDSGTGFAESNGEIPPYLRDAAPDALNGARFWLYCGERDHDGQSCRDMEKLQPLLLAHGATVDDLYRNPTGGHGILLTGEPGNPGPALTALFDYIDAIELVPHRVFLPIVRRGAGPANGPGPRGLDRRRVPVGFHLHKFFTMS